MGQVSKERLIAFQVEGWDALRVAINWLEDHPSEGIRKSSEREIEK